MNIVCIQRDRRGWSASVMEVVRHGEGGSLTSQSQPEQRFPTYDRAWTWGANTGLSAFISEIPGLRKGLTWSVECRDCGSGVPVGRQTNKASAIERALLHLEQTHQVAHG